MTNQNGSYNWGSGDNQWGNPNPGDPQPTQQFPQQAPQQAPQHQYDPQYGYAPAYQQMYQEPPKRNNLGWIVAIVVLLLAIPLAVYTFLNLSGGLNGKSGPVTNTVVETSTRTPESTPATKSTKKAPQKRTYGNWAPDTSVTSESFASNVYDEFVKEYRATGSSNVTLSVWSPVTGQTYRMTCRGDAEVHCTGGNNARVKIW